MFAKLLVSILLFFNPNMRLDAIKAASNTTSFITDVPTITSLNGNEKRLQGHRERCEGRRGTY